MRSANFGMAIDARMPIMETVIISSMSVNPNRPNRLEHVLAIYMNNIGNIS